MGMTSPTVFLYLRVSTSRQVQEGVGLDTQEARCRAYAKHMGWLIREVFSDEGLSGKDGIEDRPGLKALIAAQKATLNSVVLVYSISRLARRQRLLWDLLDDRSYALPVVSATEPFDATTPMGRAMLGMIAVWSQLEADMVSERTTDALQELKAQGKKLGPPNMLELGMTDSIREVQRLYATGGFTFVTLAQHLNAHKIPTAKGGKWWPKTIHTALQTALPPVAA
jgi:DNA invertase Pin-like site-specific DNA recombinase